MEIRIEISESTNFAILLRKDDTPNRGAFHILFRKKLNEKDDVGRITSKLGEKHEISDCRRIGKNCAEKSSPILVSLKTKWGIRTCLLQPIRQKFYHSNGIFIVPELSSSEKVIGKRFLSQLFNYSKKVLIAPVLKSPI